MEEKLRQDFPIDWEEDHYVSRREFFKFLTLASVGLAVGSAALAAASQFSRGQISFERRRVAALSQLSPDKPFLFAYPRATDPCLLIVRKDGALAAFSQRCTHLSCPVEYQPDQNRMFCPCHNGAFSLDDGHVLQGPPPRPLPRILLERVGDEVYATGVERGEP